MLGLDQYELDWRDLALCQNMDTELFYDKYESSKSVAKMVDDICLSCPVFSQCLSEGTEKNEWGVRAAIYLSGGKPDTNRNSHKSEDTWAKIKARIVE